jgi:hypothetical protein
MLTRIAAKPDRLARRVPLAADGSAGSSRERTKLRKPIVRCAEQSCIRALPPRLAVDPPSLAVEQATFRVLRV